MPGKGEIMYLCVRDINFAFFYDFSIGFWNCSDRMVLLFFLIIFIRIQYSNGPFL